MVVVFLAGLANNLEGQHGFPDGTLRSPLEVANDFCVSDQWNGVFLLGVRGALLCDGRYKLPMIALNNVMVLQIGTFGFWCAPIWRSMLGNEYCSWGGYGNWRHAFTCGALYHIRHLGVPSHIDFDVVIDSHNTILQNTCVNEQFVVYSSYLGVTRFHTGSWAGIHPNTPFERKKNVHWITEANLTGKMPFPWRLSAKHLYVFDD